MVALDGAAGVEFGLHAPVRALHGLLIVGVGVRLLRLVVVLLFLCGHLSVPVIHQFVLGVFWGYIQPMHRRPTGCFPGVDADC